MTVKQQVIVSSWLFLASLAVSTSCIFYTHSTRSTDITLVQISLLSSFQVCSCSWPPQQSVGHYLKISTGPLAITPSSQRKTKRTLWKTNYWKNVSSLLSSDTFPNGTLMLQQSTSRWHQCSMKNQP